MDNINVNYSNITEEQLDKYWENMPNKSEKETMIRVTLELFLELAAICGISLACPYIWSYLRERQMDPFACILAMILLIPIAWILFSEMKTMLLIRVFLTYGIRLQYTYAKNNLDWAHKMYLLQRLLKEENISKITNRGIATLAVEYTEENGIFKEQEVQLGSYYDRVVKEDCLDFSWMDEEINKVLGKYKLPEIV